MLKSRTRESAAPKVGAGAGRCEILELPAPLEVGAGRQGNLRRDLSLSILDDTRDIATTDAYVTSRRERKKVEMLFAHLKRILKLDRLRLRGPNGARDEFLLAATAQNLRKLAMLIPALTPIPAT